MEAPMKRARALCAHVANSTPASGSASGVEFHPHADQDPPALKSIVYTRPPRFAPGSAESIAFLHEHGYVVIKEALSQQEVATTLDKLWQYLEGLGTGIDRHDVSTWKDDRWPPYVDGGIVPSFGIGQSSAQWFVRGNTNVRKSFEALWGTEELLVSFDGMPIWRPWSYEHSWKTSSGGWLHIDQHPIARPGLHCVQGLVNLLPMGPHTGGNVLIPGSHKDFPHIPEKYPTRIAKLPFEVDHFRYPSDDPLLDNSMMCHLEPGDLLLWDSRTIHCSASALSGAEPPAPDRLLRACSLVCMLPKSKASQEVLEQRKAAVPARISTTNWTDRFIDTGRYPGMLRIPKEVREKYTLPPVPKLDQNQLRLVGFNESELKHMA